MKILKKIVKYIVLILVLLFIISFFTSLGYKKLENKNTLQSYYKKGVYHNHSHYSDGRGDINEITSDARKVGIDFVILTDHGEPNLKSSSSTQYLNDVLLIGGSELSLECGHMTVMGYYPKDYKFSVHPQEAINEVIENNGVCFIAHPMDRRIPWTDWNVKDFTGIEILNSYSEAMKVNPIKYILFPFEYLINSENFMLSIVKYPDKNIKKWNEFLRKGRYFPIYALDAHSKLEITEKFYFAFPSYEMFFKLFNIYVKIDNSFDNNAEDDSRLIIKGLKKGDFFNVIELIASANGFEAFYIDSNKEKHEMGETIQDIKGEIVVKLPFEFLTDVILKSNNKIINKIIDNKKKELRFKINERGVYWIEVFAKESKYNKIPWILTNPFFIGIDYKKTEKRQNYKVFDLDLYKIFHVEKNKSSKANLNIEEKSISLNYDLIKDKNLKDFWIALSIRDKFDFSNYDGIEFNATSSKPVKFWFELRTKEDEREFWFRHSFNAYKNTRKIRLLFKDFYPYNFKNVKMDLRKINSLFFSINNVIAYDRTNGNLIISDIKLIKSVGENEN